MLAFKGLRRGEQNTQLILTKLDQSDKYQSGSQEIPGSTPTGGNIFAEFIYRFSRSGLIANIANFV